MIASALHMLNCVHKTLQLKCMPPPSAEKPVQADQAWTTRRLLKWMSEHFAARSIDSPRVIAEMLLAHVLQCDRMRLYMEADRPASTIELAALRALVASASNHEPVQYLVGHAWFFGRQFAVNRSTLIPRPCTETLVEHIIQWLRWNPGNGAPLIADIGTGTGCIGISLALQIPDGRVVATDVVAEALALAKSNAQEHEGADRMEFRLGSGIEALGAGGAFDIICSNPPYIPDHEWDAVPPNVKEYEPASALRGGPEGLDVIGPLITQAPGILKPGGLLAIEIADCQRDAVIELANATSQLANIDVFKDQEELWRVLVAQRRDS